MNMDELFGSLLGDSQGDGEAGGGDMLSALQGMLGGSGGQGGGLTDMLGALMGGGQGQDQGAGSGVSSISQQTGIPPEILMAGLSFLLGKLTGGGQQAAMSGESAGGTDLTALMQSLQGGQAGQYIESTGLHDEFAQQTGLDPAQASQALQGVLGALRGRSLSG
jgi:hypothetical protein